METHKDLLKLDTTGVCEELNFRARGMPSFEGLWILLWVCLVGFGISLKPLKMPRDFFRRRLGTTSYSLQFCKEKQGEKRNISVISPLRMVSLLFT